MNWPRRLLFSVCACVLAACGVKGDPLPPEKSAEIGRGRPTYKRAVEEIKVEKSKPGAKAPRKSEDEDEDQD